MKHCKRSMALLMSVLLLTVWVGSSFAEVATCVDYAGSLPLDMQSETVKQEVTVRTYVDGDTTHFNVPEAVDPSGVLKARYIAVNTPESTGRIEEWGKKASNFTKEALQSADSILIESDDASWHLDSTSTRDLVWVWYRPAGETQYRNLNIELLQMGLAIANSAAQNRYGDTCMAAIAQAKANKLNIYSGEKDPDFFYGDAIELTIKELRLHPEEYEGKKVAFTGIVTLNANNSVFLESFDEETGLYFGFSAYYGFNLSDGGLNVLHVGNEVRIVGTVQYYEAGSTWQVSGLKYRMMKPSDPGNIQKLSEGHSPSWKETSLDDFWSVVMLEGEEYTETFEYDFLAQATTVTMKDLPVIGGYEELFDDTAAASHWLRCGNEQNSVAVYIPDIQDETGRALTPADFIGKVIDIRGVVENSNFLEGSYIRVYTPDALTVHE